METLSLVSSLELRAAGRKQRLVSSDAAALSSTVETCQRHIDEMVARAVRDEVAHANEGAARRLTNDVVQAYNARVDDYDRLSF